MLEEKGLNAVSLHFSGFSFNICKVVVDFLFLFLILLHVCPVNTRLVPIVSFAVPRLEVNIVCACVSVCLNMCVRAYFG